MSSHIRKYILLTLTHAECGDRAHYTPHFVVSKCRSLFNCVSVVVAKELHQSEGYHYHVGILNDTASYHTATKILRKSFPEFDGRMLNVSFHKSWNTICEYIFKQDTDPFCWGTSKEQCFERSHRRKKGKKSLDFISRLSACKSWREVITDSFLGPRVARSYSSVKQLYCDLKGFQVQESIESRLEEYLSLQSSDSKQILPYSFQDLEDRGPAMSWLGENLDMDRPIRTPQLLLVGGPGAGKTTFISLLATFCKVYKVPMRKDDFTKASTEVDFWFIDELTPKRMSSEILNLVLDGSSVDLDAKYGHLFEKRKNIPVIMACNQSPRYETELQTEAFDTRVTKCEFSKQEFKYSSERLAKTLLNIIKSRKTKKLEPSNLKIGE